ncbi:enoyl-CoA hydratase/isomerase family protein [Nocardioides sp. SYSU D00038]|uniref:enoyl-CoA hydratase/isomerase family protein n=1 Tax=Nocardioides sp. SYSU D00038 TaxID=2812554 RepID=UPI00196843BA|nr:enoyl-CoA hydratase-related protein [Nocardioides sp. SYSU D00038]
MAAPTVRTTASGRLATVVFDNAARGNAFTEPALVQLVTALEDAAAGSATSVVRLVMAGRNFCAGWDTTDFSRLASAPAEEVADSLRDNDRLLGRIHALPVPVVAAVRGRVAGFGVGLLAHLHVPIAAHDATLALPEVVYGICPGGVLHTLLRRVPRPAAELLVLSGSVVDADAMLRWGLVASVEPSTGVDAATERTAEALAAHPPSVVRAIRAATEATLSAGSAEPAYAAAAASIVRGGVS